MQIKAAIFDVDGTLLDSLGIWEKADEEYLSRRGIKPEKGLGRILYPMTVEEASAYIREHYPVEQTTEEIAKGVLEIVREFYEQKAPLKPGAEALLRKLKAQGISMAVATTGERMLVRRLLNGWESVNFSRISTPVQKQGQEKTGRRFTSWRRKRFRPGRRRSWYLRMHCMQSERRRRPDL